jgi:hypothetical protein
MTLPFARIMPPLRPETRECAGQPSAAGDESEARTESDISQCATMFPIEHGEALADEIPGARLLRLEGAGHGVDRADWDVVEAVLEHT